MSRWTSWRKLADRSGWFAEELDWEGPASYELAIAGPRCVRLVVTYVGETKNERRRVVDYASHGSHLSEIIEWHLKRDWKLYYRAQGKNSKNDAVRLQNNLLALHKYDWNVQLNRD